MFLEALFIFVDSLLNKLITLLFFLFNTIGCFFKTESLISLMFNKTAYMI